MTQSHLAQELAFTIADGASFSTEILIGGATHGMLYVPSGTEGAQVELSPIDAAGNAMQFETPVTVSITADRVVDLGALPDVPSIRIETQTGGGVSQTQTGDAAFILFLKRR